MEPLSWIVFSGAVFLGSYVQSVVGFAMGMIIVALAGASGVITLPELAAAVSIISFVNILLSLKGHLHSVNRVILPWMMAGQIPTIAVGVWIITVLDQQAQGLLQLLLGIFILLGSASMMIRPVALAQVSPSWACLVAGIGGGLSGGMFSASGPVIGWFTYRQPLELAVIRATMLAFFAVASSLRTVVVAVHGGITPDVLWLSLIALPFVTVGAWLGRVVPPNISDRAMKRAVFGLLLVMGAYIAISAVL